MSVVDLRGIEYQTYQNSLLPLPPAIEYKWTTGVEPLTSNRYLRDYGKLHNYKATMYSGRGIKFNGVDQDIDISGSITNTVKTAAFTLIDGGIFNSLMFNCWFTKTNSASPLVVQYYDDNVTYKNVVIAGSEGYKNFVVMFDYATLVLSVYGDGKHIQDIQVIAPYNTGKDYHIGSRTGAYIGGTTQNVIYFSEYLSDSEIQYLHTNPEKFLYREDSILKSKILPQSKIDAVEFYAPMCETDGFIRDYSKYSESVVSGVIDSTPSNSDEVTSYTKYDNTSYDLAVTTAGTAIDRPYLAHAFAVSNSNYHYKVSFDVVVNSGTCVLFKFYNGNSFIVSDTITTGHYEYVLPVGDDTYQYLAQYFDGTQLFDISVTNFKVEELTGVYPITNYTSDQNVRQLSTGLQTCFWERDILGVPIGSSFDGIIGDGNGYIDTGWIPSKNSYFMLETIYDMNDYPSTAYTGIGIETNNEADFYIRRYKILHTLNIKLGTTDLYVTIGSSISIAHLCVARKINGDITVFINGVSTKADTGNDYDESVNTKGRTFGLCGVNRGLFQKLQPNGQQTPIFNIHTKPQDPLELYNNAVKKGLL